jgi:hypothetical protein
MQHYALLLAIYALATWFTDPYYMNDTLWYTRDILDGGLQLWEPGHLLWRPLGWLLWQLSKPLADLVISIDDHTAILYTLVTINWLMGLLSIFSLRGLLGRVCNNEWIINIITIAFIFTQGFLNFTQTGSAYTVGLSLLLFGLYILTKANEASSTFFLHGIVGGTLLAGAVCIWFPYILAMPAALVSPLFLFGNNKQRLHTELRLVEFLERSSVSPVPLPTWATMV